MARGWAGPPLGIDFVILKTGSQGPSFTVEKAERLTRAFAEDGSITEEGRIEADVLVNLFGPGVVDVVKRLKAERTKRQNGEPSEIMDLLIGRNFWDRFKGFSNDPLEEAMA